MNTARGRLRLAPDGRPRPDAPFGRGPAAARMLARVIDGASAVGGRLPAPVAHGAARVGGTLEWAARPAKRRVLAENLGHALGLDPRHPDVRRLVRQEVVNEARRSADVLWALSHPEELRATTAIEGVHHVRDALARGNGVILSSLHLGGWEVAAAIPAVAVPVPTTALVEDDWLAWAIDRHRAAAGLGRLYTTAPAREAAAVLRRGHALLVLGETGINMTRSYRVRFLDAEAELPGGTVALARLCGSAIVPFAVLPVGRRRWRVTIEPPLLPPARPERQEGEKLLLQELADRWSALIRMHPEHWASVYPIHWVQA